VEVFERDKTKGRFNGRFSIQFDGDDNYSDVVESVNERIKDIIKENFDEYEEKGKLEKGRVLSEGTVREWNGQKYKKESGKWIPVREGGKGRGEGREVKEVRGVTEGREGKENNKKKIILTMNLKSTHGKHPMKT
jgi:hypothetical protein